MTLLKKELILDVSSGEMVQRPLDGNPDTHDALVANPIRKQDESE